MCDCSQLRIVCVSIDIVLSKMAINPVVAARIVASLEGHGQRETPRNLGVSLSSVQPVSQRYEETGLLTRRPGSGRGRSTIV